MMTMIVGIDEVGRGPWAGPLVVGAVVLDCEIDGLTDSKKLTKKKREHLYIEIMEQAAAVGLGWVQADELDEVGLSTALTLATKRAIDEVRKQKTPFHEIIIDGIVNLLQGSTLQRYVTTMKKADLLIPSVSAASIVAKVARDEYMTRQDELYPGYGFAAHVGYGTAAHKLAIETYGLTPLHRRSFAPIARLVGINVPKKRVVAEQTLTTKMVGDASEDSAANWLIANGHAIVDRNWKIKLCEIDIVSQKNGTLYFVEVKHRKNSTRGDGLAAITPKKLRQMQFAATMYVHWNNLYGSDVCLAALSTSGEPPIVEKYLELT